MFYSNIKKGLNFIDSKFELLCILFLSIIIVSLSIVMPYIGATIINNILDNDFSSAIIFVLLDGILQTINMISNLVVTKMYLNFRQKLILNIRKKSFVALINLKNNIIKEKSTGNFLNKIKDDSSKIAIALNNMKESIILALTNIGVLFVIFFINKILGLYYIFCVIIVFCIRYYGIKKGIKYDKDKLDSLDKNSTILSQVINGSKDIKSLNLKSKFIDKTNESFNEISDFEYKVNYYIDCTDKIAKFMEFCFLGGMLIISILLMKNNMLITANFIKIFMYRSKVFNFSSKIASFINNYKRYVISLNRIYSLFDYEKESFGNIKISNYSGNITFENVSFSYGKNLILKDLNLNLKGKSFITIIGESGVGKSTILNLISKTIEPDIGNIYLDDYKLSDLTEDSIRSSISLVTQQPYIFNMSIKENLSIIDDNFDNIKRAITFVGLDKKIESLENGYDTILNEDATNFSGGEKQRLAIARVLLTGTKVILLDEITNNLDIKSKKNILKLLKKLKKDYTIIMVTHDLDIIANSDRIIIISDCKIVGDGKHLDLMKTNTYYQKISEVGHA